jgi:flagellar biosynthesis/type III secretory pathway M-ring protein FliF/YscJ
MALAPAFCIFLAAVALLLVTFLIAWLHGRKVREKQIARRQDTEQGMKISAPILAAPMPAARNPDRLLFNPDARTNRATKIGPLPKYGEWI